MKNIILIILIIFLYYSCSSSDNDIEPTLNPTENVAPTAYGEVTGGINNNHGTTTDSFTFNGSSSTDPENKPMTSRWDYDGDGVWDTSYAPVNTNVSGTLEAGNFDPILEVKDDKGATSKDYLPKLGILDPDNNPINIELQVPKYIVAGEEFDANVVATEENGRPLTNAINYGNGNVNGANQGHTYSQSDVGNRNLEAIATNDYHIENSATKDVEIGSEIPYNAIVTNPIDGQQYKVKMMNDGKFWMTQNYRGVVGDAGFYEENELDNKVFGRYYSAEDVDQIGDVIFETSDGAEHTFRVPTKEDMENLMGHYGGAMNIGSLKYKEFVDGENVGATNESGFSLMLGGFKTDYSGSNRIEERGYYLTSTNVDNVLSDNQLKAIFYMSKDKTYMVTLNGTLYSVKGNVRLIKN